MGGSTRALQHWERPFREAFVDLLARTGKAIREADAEGVEQVREDVEAAARSLSSGDERLLSPRHGALLVNLHNIADAMASVARAQPVRSRAPDPRALSRRHRVSPS